VSKEFHIDTTFTGRDPHTRLIAGITAGILIVFILATMTTTIASTFLPMDDEYLVFLIPAAADGSEPVGLISLTNEVKDNTISIAGIIVNRTEQPISDLVAVIQMQETTGRFPQTQEVHVMPAELQPDAEGTFTASATLEQKPSGFLVKFRLADGPFLPHLDDRPGPLTITPAPKPSN
jgi:hypothetical protein